MTIAEKEPYDPILLTLTGAIVTWWGRIESSMFQDLLTLQHYASVQASGVCRPFPMATKRLISTWLKATRMVETEQRWLDEVDGVAIELRECAETRHIIVHGFWDYPSPETMHQSKITIVKPKGEDQIEFKQYPVDRQWLWDTEKQFRSLYHRMLPFGLNHTLRLPRTP